MYNIHTSYKFTIYMYSPLILQAWRMEIKYAPHDPREDEREGDNTPAQADSPTENTKLPRRDRTSQVDKQVRSRRGLGHWVSRKHRPQTSKRQTWLSVGEGWDWDRRKLLGTVAATDWLRWPFFFYCSRGPQVCRRHTFNLQSDSLSSCCTICKWHYLQT